jgi:hypothetical protein
MTKSEFNNLKDKLRQTLITLYLLFLPLYHMTTKTRWLVNPLKSILKAPLRIMYLRYLNYPMKSTSSSWL